VFAFGRTIGLIMLAGAAFAAKETLSGGLELEARPPAARVSPACASHRQCRAAQRYRRSRAPPPPPPPQAASERIGAWWSARSDGPVVAAWIAAGALGVSLVDYVCSLPVLNLLLPGAFQALGIAVAAVGALRYLKEGKPVQPDIDATGEALQALLPGLKK
jgi:hypothetical protein